MNEQLHDFFGEIFQRYFRPAIDAYPRTGGALVERLLCERSRNSPGLRGCPSRNSPPSVT